MIHYFNSVLLQILKQYKSRCDQLRDAERLFIKDQTHISNKEETFTEESKHEKPGLMINTGSKTTFSDLPMIRLSEVILPQKYLGKKTLYKK